MSWFWQPLPAAGSPTHPDSGAGHEVSTRPGRWQYKIMTEPVFVPAAPSFQGFREFAENILPPMRVRALSTAILAGACFIPFPVQAPVPRYDSYHPNIEVRATEPKDQSYITGSEFSADLIPIVRVESWHPEIEKKAREPVDQSYITDSYFAADPIPIVRTESWHPAIEKKADDFKDQQYIVEQQYLYDSLVEGDFVGTWHPAIVQPLTPPDRQFQSEFRTEVVTAAAEVVTLDKWYAELQRPTLRARTNILLPGTVQLLLPETPRLDRWFAETQQPTRRPQTNVLISLGTQLLLPETPRLDRWYAETQQPTRRARTNILLPGSAQLLLPETPTLDRWYPSVALPVFVRPRAQFQTEFRTERSMAAAVVVLDWLGHYPDRIDARRSLTHITQGDLVLTQAQRPEAVSVDRWFAPIVQLIGKRLHVPGPFSFEPIFIPTPEGAVTLDKWYRELSLPKFLRWDWYYIYASGSNFFTITPTGGAGNDRLIIVDGRFAIKIGKRTYTFI